jgi:hypothetical protein
LVQANPSARSPRAGPLLPNGAPKQKMES